MAQVSIAGDRLRVYIGVLETIQALQGSFSIPLSNVRGATEDENYIRSALGFRSPGTGFPGLVAKGTFRKIGEKVLTIWHRNQQVVVIELVNSKWDRLVLGCEDAKSLADSINKALLA